MRRIVEGLVFALFVMAAACAGVGTPDARDLENVEARLNYLREIDEIAWLEKQPPATIVIGWKKFPAADFGSINRAAAFHASKLARGVRIVSVPRC